MLAIIPKVPLLENIGLGIALMSYDGRVFFGFTADYDLVPDLDAFVDDVAKSFAGLAEAAGVELSRASGPGEPDSGEPDPGAGEPVRPRLLPPIQASGS
jgi:hypothetical protein